MPKVFSGASNAPPPLNRPLKIPPLKHHPLFRHYFCNHIICLAINILRRRIIRSLIILPFPRNKMSAAPEIYPTLVAGFRKKTIHRLLYSESVNRLGLWSELCDYWMKTSEGDNRKKNINNTSLSSVLNAVRLHNMECIYEKGKTLSCYHLPP